MCGIAGFVSLTGNPPDPERLLRMVATLRHRGPDDHGGFTDGPAALGAARLSIIDVAGGHQPISIDGGAITVAQNGEIYNYLELRDDLHRAGRRLATACDTEVIAHLYATDGVEGFRRMRGMFALAIWDAPNERLVLARDRVGKKPLYYLNHGGEILFGSETKAILAALGAVPPVSAEALLSFFTFGYVAGSGAAFHGMRRLPPGAALIVDVGRGTERIEPFWKWPAGPEDDADVIGAEEAIEAIRAELAEAVRIRLRSDVPLGAFLSGGMDSAAVLALMTRQSSQPVKTFTIGFGDPVYDELDDARATAAHFGAEHHEHIVTPDCVRVAEALAIYYDEPFADASAIPTFHVAELARKHVTVCLTGDGGDELFAGYTPYADALARVGSAGLQAFRSVLAAGARRMPVHVRGKGRLTTWSLGPEAWFVWRRTVFPDYLLEAVVDGDLLAQAGRLPEHRALAELQGADGPLLGRLQHWDQRHYLPDDILVKVDRASMAVSLEFRAPFLGREIAESFWRLPTNRKISGLTTKKHLREEMNRRLPAEVRSHPKRGFGPPLSRMLRRELKDEVRRVFEDSGLKTFFRADKLTALLDAHVRGHDQRQLIWRLYVLGRFLDNRSGLR